MIGEPPEDEPLFEDEIVEIIAKSRAFADRLEANMVKNKPLLDRLAREGDCWQCRAVDGGCDRHRIAQAQFIEGAEGS